MPQLAIVSFGDSAAVVLSPEVLRSLDLQIGDLVDATVTDRQLILRPQEDTICRHRLDDITREVFEQRKDAYQRFA